MTKHILRAAEFLRDLVARLVIEVRHLSGRTMIADLLTEAVARVMYHELLRLFDAYAASYLTRRATIGRLANPPQRHQRSGRPSSGPDGHALLDDVFAHPQRAQALPPAVFGQRRAAQLCYLQQRAATPRRRGTVRTSTARRTGAWSQPRQARQGSTGSTGKASTTGSTAPRRSLDSSTARQPGLNPTSHMK
jgi:hypothetical protein